MDTVHTQNKTRIQLGINTMEEDKERVQQKHKISRTLPASISRWERNTKLPEGAILLNPYEVKQVIEKKLSAHPDYTDTFLLQKGPVMAASVAGVTASYLAAGMPKVFSYSASSSLAMIAGTTLVSVLPTVSSQTFFIREPIISGLNVSLPQVLATSLATQTVFGVFCPCFLTTLRMFSTQNNSSSLKGNFAWMYKAILQNKKFTRMLYGCLTVQIVFGGLLPYFTLIQFEDFVANVVSPK
uniref:Uncharacterized protein n=3 Tax=Magallana gigas TaxID=29159 RepID=A0A8W8IL38_MAGGI|nr:uncharacterized protein LOC105320889 isoform X1 [Crassostrea gigas]|eukprot:XP_019919916.1 PREDICTED: uncharacterized protein LOC105320889 isoform X1 [Crassostrea gigas]